MAAWWVCHAGLDPVGTGKPAVTWCSNFKHCLNTIKYVAEISRGLVQPEVTLVSLYLYCSVLSVLAQLQFSQIGLRCALVPHLTLAQTCLQTDASEDLQAMQTSDVAVCNLCLLYWCSSLIYWCWPAHKGGGLHLLLVRLDLHCSTEACAFGAVTEPPSSLLLPLPTFPKSSPAML